jgi:hypothetical protein
LFPLLYVHALLLKVALVGFKVAPLRFAFEWHKSSSPHNKCEFSEAPVHDGLEDVCHGFSAELARKRGCTDIACAFALVEQFASELLVQQGTEAKPSASLRKHAIDIGNATRQMLRAGKW